MKSRIKGIASRSWRKAARGTSIRDAAPHPERAGCRNKHNNAHGRAHAHARKIRARRVGLGRRRDDRRLLAIRAGAGQGADPDRLPAADHRPARLARRRNGERLPAVLGTGRHDRRRAQDRDRHRRHPLQSGSGADPGAPPRAAGEGTLHGRGAGGARGGGGWGGGGGKLGARRRRRAAGAVVLEERPWLGGRPGARYEGPAVAQVSKETGVPLVMDAAGADNVTKWDRTPTVVRTAISSSQIGHPFGEYLYKELGLRNVTFIGQDY